MTIDERLQFLLQSTESLHSSVHELTGDVQRLTEAVSKHEKRWELVRKVMQAAFEAGLDAANDDHDNDESK
ncbi:MAG TPA: hypothetical protein VG206_14435 [Terriglobia bacterium]|nr:hypothetical protein [Terriglobia bacterium]